MRREAVRERLEAAIDALLLNDQYLLEIDAAERSIAARLALYLIGVFPSHDVDIEYNRHGLNIKTIAGVGDASGNPEERIFPDIVIHRRGSDDDNLMVIEVKKSTNREDRDRDRTKLTALRTEYGYEYCVLLDVPVHDRAGDRPIPEWT